MARMNPTVRAWLIMLAALAAVVGVIALAGGFAPRDRAPLAVPAGQEVSLSRWDITVHSCQIKPDDEDPGGRISVQMDATNRWNATQDRLVPAVGVRLPTGEEFGFQRESLYTYNLDGGGGFDPGFAAAAEVRVETEQPLWDATETVEVILHDEDSSDGFLSSARMYPSRTVAVVTLQCTVAEED